MEEQRSYQIAYEHLSRKYKAHVSTVKSNNHFYITALESALVETKFESRQEIERLNMTIAETESKEMNNMHQNSKISSEVDKFEGGEVSFTNLREARELINKFVGMIKSKDNQLSKMNKSLDKMTASL